MSDGENTENGWLGMTTNSPYPVYVKEERSSRTHQVPPGGTWDGGVDDSPCLSSVEGTFSRP